jgi:hypothetical protein
VVNPTQRTVRVAFEDGRSPVVALALSPCEPGDRIQLVEVVFEGPEGPESEHYVTRVVSP